MLRFLQQSSIFKNVRGAFISPCSEDGLGPTDEKEEKVCLCVCQAIAPVVRYCQFFGIAPICFHSSYEKSRVKSSRTTIQRQDCEVAVGEKVEVTHTFAKLRRKKCGISSRWNTLPSFTNAILLLSFASVTSWFFIHIPSVLKVYFEGTDLYTFGTQTLCLYSQCNLILINAFLQRKKFCEIWALITKILRELITHSGNCSCNSGIQLSKIQSKLTVQSISDKAPVDLATNGSIKSLSMAATILQNLGQTASERYQQKVSVEESTNDAAVENEIDPSKFRSRLRKIRICSYIAVMTVLILSILHVVAFIQLVFTSCFDSPHNPVTDAASSIVKNRLANLPCPFSSFFLFLQKLFYGMIDFVQQGLALLFGMLCLVIYTFFEEIEDQLEKTLKDGSNIKSIGVQANFRVDKLRMIYEDLSRCCRLMSQCFGLSVLAVMISSVVSITCALYSFTLYSGAIKKSDSILIARYYVIWAFHGWFGAFCLFLILIPGQMLTNASGAPSHVIGRCSLSNLDKETKYQLSQFQHQCRDKVVITAWNVTNVGLGFIAAAATNVTTYILVILQFRLGVEK